MGQFVYEGFYYKSICVVKWFLVGVYYEIQGKDMLFYLDCWYGIFCGVCVIFECLIVLFVFCVLDKQFGWIFVFIQICFKFYVCYWLVLVLVGVFFLCLDCVDWFVRVFFCYGDDYLCVIVEGLLFKVFINKCLMYIDICDIFVGFFSGNQMCKFCMLCWYLNVDMFFGDECGFIQRFQSYMIGIV